MLYSFSAQSEGVDSGFLIKMEDTVGALEFEAVVFSRHQLAHDSF